MILHPDLAHAGGPNLSHDIRRMIYFRVKHTPSSMTRLLQANGYDIEENSCEEMDIEKRLAVVHNRDMWVDLPGVTYTLSKLRCMEL
jgi:hypothetical protein